MRFTTTLTLAGRLALALCLPTVALSGCANLLDRAAKLDEQQRPVAPVKMTLQEKQVFDETNAFRVRQGLPALMPDERLTEIARGRSQDMAARGYFSHVAPDGGDVFAVLRQQQVRFWAAGENIARNNYPYAKSPRVAVQDWIESPGHRANMLHPAFGHIGVGIAKAKDGQIYLTQVFTD